MRQRGYTLIEMLVVLITIIASCTSFYLIYLLIRVANKYLGGA